MSAEASSRIKTHVGIGITYGVVIGIIQGFVEALILSVHYHEHIFKPRDIFQSHVFLIMGKILDFDRIEGIPFILDRYLGHNFVDKVPLICSLIVVYALVGLIMGICLGVFFWALFRLAKIYLNSEKLSTFYLSFILSFAIFVNLILLLDTRNIITTFSVTGFLISLSLLAAALLFALLIYKRGKVALIAAGLVICLAVVLNVWLFTDTDGESETFAVHNDHNRTDGLIDLNNRDVNVIFISIDSLRADHLSCYGYSRKTSPNIDKLASEGVLFSNAFSTTSWTLPSHLSMLTSMYSKSHGVITDDYALDRNRVTLAEVLKKAGYATAAFVSAPYLDSIYGFDQGFDLYDDSINGILGEKDRNVAEQEARELITSPRLNGSIKKWLGGNYKKKFFLFVHYFDVHYDYIPPPPFDTMFDPDYTGKMDARNFVDNPEINPTMNPRDLFHIISLYDGEIAFTDKHIGDLFSYLRKLNIYDKTLIVLTADHGDEFFEHGKKGHRRSLYDEVLKVPLIFKFPYGVEQNTKVEQVVSIIDIMPTIIGYLGIEPHKEIQGRNLLSSINGMDKSNDSLVYSRLEYKLVAARSAHSKLIHHLNDVENEFYDMINDPQEKVNLLSSGSINDLPESEEHLVSLLNWLNEQREIAQTLPQADTNKKLELSEGMKEQLKALGYIQ